ncbi:Helix-turn-helix domain-containing protein [Actinokineospora globicatena]|nr:Helix-turn-helix domain-containing protein [Actinokineospora globicatena]GLW78552.1 hypothetical protein Aglo01_30340 [Actinokineospora globicatena]GLW84784.1 hypothetical protein Aglo02_24240 [Actinokineospora globicatena]
MSDVGPRDAADSTDAATLLASEIKRRRLAANLSQPQLASAIGYTRQYVSLAERQRANLPSHELINAIDAALQANGELVDLRVAARAQRIALRTRSPEPSGSGDGVDRREFLGATTAAVIGLSAFFANRGGHLGASNIGMLTARTAQLRRLDNYLGGSDTYQIYAAELERTVAFARTARCTDVIMSRLLGVVAEQAQMAGWAAFDAGMLEEATSHYEESLAAARESGDAALEGNALAFLAYVDVSAKRPNIQMAEDSFATAARVATPRVKALLAERKAWTYAVAGDVANTDRSLAVAREALSLPADDVEPDWVFWVDEDELDIMAGRCWTELQRPLRAVPLLDKALSRFDPLHARDKSLYQTWLAHSLVDGGEIERAASVLTDSHRLASGVGSVRPLNRVREVSRRLEPHRQVHVVAQALQEISLA